MASTLSIFLLSLLSPLAYAGPIPINAPLSSSPTTASGQPFLTRRDSSSTGCTSSSFGGFAWSVEGFTFNASYIFTTPAHQNSWGYASFDLSNPAAGFRTSCSGASDQLKDFFYGTMPYTCEGAQGQGLGGTTKTTFDFSRPSGLLRVNQTWSCNDEDPQSPTTFKGYGAVNLTLACTDQTWQNPNWTDGQIYSDREIRCQPVDAMVKPYQIDAEA